MCCVDSIYIFKMYWHSVHLVVILFERGAEWIWAGFVTLSIGLVCGFMQIVNSPVL
jgi:hypothetical protein